LSTLKADVDLVLEDLCRLIEKRFKVRSVVLFGSVARGDFSKLRDIDIIVVSDEFPESYSSRLDMVRPALFELKDLASLTTLRRKGHHVRFDVATYRSDDLDDTPPLLLDVSVDGVLLRDDGVMREKLARLRQRMGELGSRRIRTKTGRWYWLLKPDLKPGEIIQL